MAATPIQITTADGTRHDFEVVYIGKGRWGVNHPATQQAAGRALMTGTSWSAHVQDSADPAIDTDTIFEEWFGDKHAAAYAVAHEYARRFLTAPEEGEVIPDDFEIQIPEGAEYHEDAFTIEQDEGGENRQYTLDEVKVMDMHHVWTVVESDSENGPYWAVPGFRYVNRDHYRVTSEPWSDEHIDKEYVA